jgi:repressor LexA
MKWLTTRQVEVFRYIWNFVEENGYPPTIREICVGIGIVPIQTQAITDHLNYIEKKGYITRDGDSRSRGIVILKNLAGKPVRLRYMVANDG